MSISYCPFCGTEVVCFDHEDWGGPTPGCPKCGIAFIKEVRYKFVWFQGEEVRGSNRKVKKKNE